MPALPDDLPPLPAPLARALPVALGRIRATPGVLGIVWCGSAAQGLADEHSDLDFHVLVEGEHRWISTFAVDGVPVEVFHNPIVKVRAMIEEPDAATLAMYAGGRVLLNHPELDVLTVQARVRLAAGCVPRELSAFERHKLVDQIWEGRSAVGQPIHSLLAMETLDRLVHALYAVRGWWDVKPKHWLVDLEVRDPVAADHLRAALETTDAHTRQAALEALALMVLDNLKPVEGGTLPEPVP